MSVSLLYRAVEITMPYNSCLLLSVTEAFAVLIKSRKSKDDLHQNMSVTSDRIHSKTQPCSGEPCRTACVVTLEVGRRYKEYRDVLSSSINQCSPRIIKRQSAYSCVEDWRFAKVPGWSCPLWIVC
jgi:hypothetical protein